MREIIERLEKLTGPDRETDYLIGLATNDIPLHWRFSEGNILSTFDLVRNSECNYTASLDAAIALVERCLPGCYREMSGPRKYLNIPAPVPNRFRAEITTDAGFNSYTAKGWGASEAIALLIALLKALEASHGDAGKRALEAQDNG